MPPLKATDDLTSLGIAWKGGPQTWRTIPRTIVPVCSAQGVVKAGTETRFTLKPSHTLGAGTFGLVDAFWRIPPDSTPPRLVALKRPRHPAVDIFIEALIQWRIRKSLEEYGLAFCVPEVIDIIRDQRTGSIWFTMEAFSPSLLSDWIRRPDVSRHFGKVLLQLALLLEVLEVELLIDHRDLKVNNLLILDEPVEVSIDWNEQPITLHFPFRIILVDFGFTCEGGLMDVRAGDGLPPLDACPKLGRDLFQILVSLWSLRELRDQLETTWGAFIRACIEPYASWVDSKPSLDWMYTVTDKSEFTAPRCAPSLIITECMSRIER